MGRMLSSREILRQSLLGLFRPVIRLALKNSFKFRDVVECLKIVFVRVAKEELLRANEEITISKLSVMTGLQRRDLTRLTQEEIPVRRDQDLISRIIGLWQSAGKFKDKTGKPKILSFKGRQGDFAELVASVSTDLNPYTIAFELERAGIAKETPNGLQLVKAGYQPKADLKAGLKLLEQDSDTLLQAVSQNIFECPEIPNLHVKTEYDNIPESKMKEVREWFLNKGAIFHKEAREYLSRLDRDIHPESSNRQPKGKRVRASIGTFSFTEQVED